MLDYLTRVLFAALVSGLCFLGTYYWYVSNPLVEIKFEEAEQVAELTQSENEVQRKPTGKIIWQVATDNERLRLGDAVRTNSVSEAVIEFLKSGNVIELEPNSLVIIEEFNGELSLDFLKGNLILRGDGQGIHLKSGGRSIAYNGELSIGRSGSGMIDIQVFDGQATVASANKTSSLKKGQAALIDKDGKERSQNLLEVTYPLLREHMYVTPGEEERSFFKWKPLGPNYQVALYMGPTRDELKRFDKATIEPVKGVATVNLPVGKYYWQLIAVSRDQKKPTLYSPVSRNQIIAKVPPVLLSPQKDSNVIVAKNKKPVFRWANPAKLNNLLLEVSTDSSMKNKVISEALPPGDLFESPLEKPGSYYWRIVGYLGRNKEPVPSDVQMFRLEKAGSLRPPKLTFPKPNQGLALVEVKEKGVYLKWEQIPGVRGYYVTASYEGATKGLFSGESSIAQQVKVPQFKLPNVEPGEFVWQVQSVGEKDKMSSPSKPQRFFVETVGQILWANGKTRETYIYKSLKPEFSVSWKSGARNTSSYRVRWAASGEPLKGAPWKSTTKNTVLAKVDTDGQYVVEVQALDKSQKVIAKSSQKTVIVQMEPLLPAPVYAELTPQTVTAKRNGSMKIAWKNTDGAKAYKLKILDKEGRVIREVDSKSSQQTVNDLLPGEYKLSLQAVDKRGRPGKANDNKVLRVPKQSDVKAPKIKAIKVN